MRPIRTPAELGAAIRQRRRNLRWTQAELAARAGVSRPWLSAVETGKPGAEMGLVLGVLDALGVSIQLRELPSLATDPTQQRIER